MIRTAMLAILTILLIGCQPAAVKREPVQESLADKEAYWKSKVGSATYDDVVSWLGPPAYKNAETDESFAAVWVSNSSWIGTVRVWR